MARQITLSTGYVVEETPDHELKLITPGGLDPIIGGDDLDALADFLDEVIVGANANDEDAPDTDPAGDGEDEDEPAG